MDAYFKYYPMKDGDRYQTLVAPFKFILRDNSPDQSSTIAPSFPTFSFVFGVSLGLGATCD